MRRPFTVHRSLPRRRWQRVVGYLLLLALILMTVGAGAGYFFLRRSLPPLSGTLAVPGLQAPVTVDRDSRGVPHIAAATRHDLYFAQGFVTATDRLFQMDLSRRAAAGRLSEIFGASQIDTDKFLRSLLMRPAAEASLSAYPPETLEILQAYADGVNAWIRSALREQRLPPEFTLLGYQPEEWAPVDSTSIGKFMAYDLGGNWSAEVWNYQLIQRVGAEKAAELLPQYPADGPTIMKVGGRTSLDVDSLMRTAYLPDPWLGSNNWVLAGSRTASGKPLLANDPHLGIRTPSVWYQTHLVLAEEGLNVVGVTFPGAPGIVIGRNERIAWGVTNMAPDVQDLYVEIPNPQNPREFLYDGRYEPAQVIDLPIRVKDRPDPVPFSVLVTRHGPIITPVAGSKESRPDAALALRWTAHQPTAELAAVLMWNRAGDWREFREALRLFQVPAQNFVFAAVDGTIAYRGNGQVPIRRKGNGRLPVPGWTSEYEWSGFIPWEQLPEVVNPAEGFIATANNQVVDDAYPHFLAANWAPVYRQQRIRDVLTDAQGWTVTEMQSLQNDWLDLQARTLLPVLLPALEQGLGGAASPLQAEALAALRQWDGVDHPDAAAPAIWQAWYRELQRQLYVPTMGQELWERMTDAMLITDRVLLAAGRGQPSAWLPAGGLSELATASFQRAVAALERELGSRPVRWQWGSLHRLTFAHPLAAVRPLDLLFNAGSYKVGGAIATVGNQSFRRVGPGYGVTSNSSWRQVVDLADAGNGWDVVPPGLSGHPLSRHYRDQARLYVRGQYGPQHLLMENVQARARLELVPGL